MSGVRVTSEGPGLSLPSSLSGVSSTPGSGENEDWEDGGGAPGGVPGGGNFELDREGGDPLVHAHGNFGATETIDPTLGNVHTGTIDDDCTVTLSTTLGTAGTLLLWWTWDGSGGHVITWAGTVTENGVPDTSPDTTNRAIASTVDGGATWVVDWIGGGLDPDDVEAAGRWELAVIPGSPPDPLYADGDYLYIWVPG